MENPATWGKTELTIQEALIVADEGRKRGVCGVSTPMQIANALRKEGLLVENNGYVINVVQRIAPTEKTIGPFLSSDEASAFANTHRTDEWMRVQIIPLTNKEDK